MGATSAHSPSSVRRRASAYLGGDSGRRHGGVRGQVSSRHGGGRRHVLESKPSTAQGGGGTPGHADSTPGSLACIPREASFIAFPREPPGSEARGLRASTHVSLRGFPSVRPSVRPAASLPATAAGLRGPCGARPFFAAARCEAFWAVCVSSREAAVWTAALLSLLSRTRGEGVSWARNGQTVYLF